MRPFLMLFAALAATSVAVPAARAQVAAEIDSGLFIVFEHDQPIANERYVIEPMGDSLVIGSVTQRHLTDEKGQRHLFRKNMALTVDSRDFGLLRYFSIQEFQEHTVSHGLVPTDTVITYYREHDGVGEADRVVQPPGRMFVMDSQVFSLFHVLTRSLAGKQFVKRPVQMLALLTDSLGVGVATVTLVRLDTLGTGSGRIVARHYTFDDRNLRFELWADSRGRLLRLAHEASGLSVERAPEAEAAVPARRRGKSGR